MITEIESMVDIEQDVIDEAREWMPLWSVELVHGNPETVTGVIIERKFITKKWERVDSLIESYAKQVQAMPLEKRANYFVTVTELVGVKRGHFVLA